MIKASLVIEEKDPPSVNVTIEAPPANINETEAESKMLLTYLAFSNCISDPRFFEPLGEILIPEINRIIAEMSKDAS